jgi:hypothetical protein
MADPFLAMLSIFKPDAPLSDFWAAKSTGPIVHELC